MPAQRGLSMHPHEPDEIIGGIPGGTPRLRRTANCALASFRAARSGSVISNSEAVPCSSVIDALWSMRWWLRRRIHARRLRRQLAIADRLICDSSRPDKAAEVD